MQFDSQSRRAIERQSAAGSVRPGLATNEVIRNTYLLLVMMLALRALTAAASMVMNLPHPVLIVALEA